MTSRKGERWSHLRVVSANTPSAYALPATEVSREMFEAAQLKAALTCNGDLAALVRRAVAEFEPVPTAPSLCPACHKEGRWRPARTSVNVHGVTVMGVPTVACAVCGASAVPPVSLMVALEEILADHGPGVVYFDELLAW